MTRRSLMVGVAALMAVAVVAIAVLAIFAYVRVEDFLQAESAQRVTTLGERCESQLHQADEHGPEEQWFLQAHRKCLGSLAKVEKRAGVSYKTP